MFDPHNFGRTIHTCHHNLLKITPWVVSHTKIAKKYVFWAMCGIYRTPIFKKIPILVSSLQTTSMNASASECCPTSTRSNAYCIFMWILFLQLDLNYVFIYLYTNQRIHINIYQCIYEFLFWFYCENATIFLLFAHTTKSTECHLFI